MQNNMEEAKEEFKDVITQYILPLFGAIGELAEQNEASYNRCYVEICEKNSKIIAKFYPQISSRSRKMSPYFYETEVYSESMKGYAERILNEMMKVTRYNTAYPYKIKRYYGKNRVIGESLRKRSLDWAFEFGMCASLTSKNEDASTLHSVIEKMTEWSMRTYEGKSVPFGIVIDFKIEEKEGLPNYIQFLDNDNSAVFTDGVFTGILLDAKGNVVRFIPDSRERSRDEDASANMVTFVPYQFTELARECTNERVGIISLANGEIILIKKRSVYFAKRGKRWVFFDYDLVLKSIRPFLKAAGFDEEKISRYIKALYCSLLDVSFSHTGGCIALISRTAESQIGSIVKERLDLWPEIVNDEETPDMTKEKLGILRYLLRIPATEDVDLPEDANCLNSFFEINRRLRKEILSLDGATVVSQDGKFFCVGSIVMVDGGSTGGGRAAAAKNLARYGIGIKISEDGYIEAYAAPQTEENGVCAEKEIKLLFKFK